MWIELGIFERMFSQKSWELLQHVIQLTSHDFADCTHQYCYFHGWIKVWIWPFFWSILARRLSISVVCVYMPLCVKRSYASENTPWCWRELKSQCHQWLLSILLPSFRKGVLHRYRESYEEDIYPSRIVSQSRALETRIPPFSLFVGDAICAEMGEKGGMFCWLSPLYSFRSMPCMWSLP